MIETGGGAAEGATVLSMAAVWRRYERGAETVTALTGVDLEVQRGEIVAVVGRSGSGKSTLLHIAGGLDLPDEGSVRVLGSDPVSMTALQRARLRRSTVGFVFQFFHLLPQLTVAENVELPLQLGAAPGARERAAEMVESVGLASRSRHFPAELSGGELQRVAVARALVTGATLVLADEPTGNLDTSTGSSILDLLCERVRTSGAALLLVTHDSAAAGRADRVLTLVDGRLE